MKSKKNLAILIGAGTVVAAAGITTGLVLGLRNNEDTTKVEPKKFEEIKKEENQVDEFYIQKLHDEQRRINNLKANGKYKPPSSTSSVEEEVRSIKDFNEEEAKKFGIDFSGFNTDIFEYKYYFLPIKQAIQIHTKLREEEYQKFDPDVHAANIQLLIADPNQPKKTPETDEKKEEEKKALEKAKKSLEEAQNSLNSEQTRINKLKIENISLLQPTEEIKNEIFNESIAELYGLESQDFDFKKFSYTYSTKQEGITIVPEIKDYNLEKILEPEDAAKTIEVKWKTQKDVKLEKLDKEQERINKLESTSEALLNQPVEKDLIKSSDKRVFDETVAASYQIDYNDFNTDLFTYTYFSEGDEGIMIVPHMKNEDDASQPLSPEIAPKLISIYWKNWYSDWISKYKKSVEKDYISNISWDKINPRLKRNKGSYKKRDIQDIIRDEKITGITFPEPPHGMYISLIAPYRVEKGLKKVYYAGPVRNSRNHVNRIMFTITYK